MKDSRDLLDTLFQEMVVYYGGDPERIQHFIKVHSFSAYIGRKENISEEEQIILEAAAYVHDIGIKAAERIYGSSDGKYQEELGPELAEDMLGKCGFSEVQVQRVSYLVGHHHTYTDMDGSDYQILVEADFLVNLHENHSSGHAIQTAYDKIFKTETGKMLCKTMFQSVI